MKAVTADALVTQLARQTRQGCEVRHAMMKGGIEAGDLGQVWASVADCGDSGQIVRLMQRSKRHELAQPRLQRLGYECGAITFRAAMDNAVPDCRQTVSGGVPVDRIQKQMQSHVVVSDFCRFIERRRPCCVNGVKTAMCKADAVDGP